MNKKLLIRIEMKKKYINWFKILMSCFAVFSLLPIWNVYNDGYFITHGIKLESNNVAVIVYSLKFILLAGLFVWLATLGVKEKQKKKLSGTDPD
jgi:hypothetical protein